MIEEGVLKILGVKGMSKEIKLNQIMRITEWK